MNGLVAKMRVTLADLDLGLKGALSMSDKMQQLFDDINLNVVPEVRSPNLSSAMFVVGNCSLCHCWGIPQQQGPGVVVGGFKISSKRGC